MNRKEEFISTRDMRRQASNEETSDVKTATKVGK
jgi:hypothetical protein